MSELTFKKNNIGIGKRKKSIARVFLISGTGKLTINKISGDQYLQHNKTYLKSIQFPLEKLNLTKKFDIIALVNGGGLTGQTSSIQLGISRLLCQLDINNRKILKPLGLLTRDSRIKERKKYGLKKARKAPQYSKR